MKIKFVFLRSILVASIFLVSFLLLTGEKKSAGAVQPNLQTCKSTLLQWVTFVVKNGEPNAVEHVYFVLGTDKFLNSKGDPLSRWIVAFSGYLIAGARPQELGIKGECESFLGTGVDVSRLPKPSQKNPARVFMVPTTTEPTTTLPVTKVQKNDRSSKMLSNNFGFNDAYIAGMTQKYLWVFNTGGGVISGSSNADYSIHPDRKPRGLLQISLKKLVLTSFNARKTYCGIGLTVSPRYWRDACSSQVTPFRNVMVKALDLKTCPTLDGVSATLVAEDNKYAWIDTGLRQAQARLVRVVLKTGSCTKLSATEMVASDLNLGNGVSGFSDGSTFWFAVGHGIFAVDESTLKYKFQVQPDGFSAASNLLVKGGKLWVGTHVSSKKLCPMFGTMAPCSETFQVLGLSPSSGAVIFSTASKGVDFGNVQPDGFGNIELAADSQKLWISCLDSRKVLGLSIQSGAVLTKIDLGSWWSGGQIISNGKLLAVVLVGTQGASPQTVVLYSAQTGEKIAVLGQGTN